MRLKEQRKRLSRAFAAGGSLLRLNQGEVIVAINTCEPQSDFVCGNAGRACRRLEFDEAAQIGLECVGGNVLQAHSCWTREGEGPAQGGKRAGEQRAATDL